MRYRWLGLVLIAACGSPAATPVPPPGEIIGRVEVSPDVPAAGCLVLLEGVPIGAACDQDGGFDLKGVPPGRWDLRVLPDMSMSTLPSRRIAVGANSAFVSDLGAVELAQPGSVGGHVTADNATLAVSYIAVPELGAVTAPNAGGGYLLAAVAPGAREIVLIAPTGAVTNQGVTVVPQKTTIDVDFDLALAQLTASVVNGQAARADGTSSGIVVELLSALDGTTAQSATLGADGGFSLTANPGAYVVRAHDGSNPAKPIIPSVVVGSHDVTLGSTLLIPVEHGDLDGDGIPDDQDPDIDGDGVPNAQDAFPYDPAESKDTDGDGIGDRADLSSTGSATVDQDTPTPDTDGDGLLDFEDNCPLVPNPDQTDTDHDGIGDACDTCPLVPNPDQGTTCLQCLTDDQCGNLVCESNHCVACTSTTQCSSGHTCNTAVGICVQCVTDPDCGANHACVDGTCVADCTDNNQCPGAFCVNDKCQQCRGNADCANNQYCDVGACRPQCSTDGDCANGRTCDVPTGTCVQPCGTGCASGTVCVTGVCHRVCDGSDPCPSGFDCDAGLCTPQCMVTNDCSGHPHTLCDAGACVPDGSCTFDADCAPADLCAAGTCLQRPTAFDPGLGYECTSACDCRTGETCDGTNHCVNDVVDFGDGASRSLTPTFWAQAGASGDGTTPMTPGDPAAGLALVTAGNGTMLALRGGDSLSVGAVVALPHGEIAIAGGYHVCAANRWVRDSSLRTTITTSVNTTFSIPGTVGTPVPHVAILGLSLMTIDPAYNQRRVFIDAAYATALFVQDSDFAPLIHDDVALEYGDVVCDHCDAVTIDHITAAGSPVPSGATSVQYHGVSVTSGYGTFSNITINGMIGAYRNFGIDVNPTTGPVTITNATIGTSGSQGGAGLSATCGVDTNGVSWPITIGNSAVGWNTQNLNNNDDSWNGVFLTQCRTTTLHDITVDGSAFTNTGGGGHSAFALFDSSGTLTNIHAILASSTNGAAMDGLNIQGPHGAYTISHPSVSGGAGSETLTLVLLTNITQGTVAIDHATLSSISGSEVTGVALTGSGTPGSPALILTDSSVTTNGSENLSNALSLAGSTARVERTSLVAAAGINTTGVSLTASSILELYDSFAFADAPTPTNVAVAVKVQASQLFAVGDTFDANGSLTAQSFGLSCDSLSTTMMSSSLVSGGLGTTHVMVTGAGAVSCLIPANFDHNYFWYARPGSEDAFDQVTNVATAAVGVPDGNGNIIGNNVSCYDGAFATPNFHVASGTPCIDAGVAGARHYDASPLTLDIAGGPRTLGTHADIGCFEKQ